MDIETQFMIVANKAVNEWGLFRRFIARHPLTGFWFGVVVGAGAGAFATWVA